MRGFLYFIPGIPVRSRERLDAEGLGYLLDGRGGPGPLVAETMSGPDGQRGSVFSVAGRGGAGAPEPNDGERWKAIRWSKISNTKAWLGVMDDALPGPVELRRAEQVDGHEVELGDGARWLVPVVRAIGGGTRLPRALVPQGGDWVAGDVRPTYRKLWAAGLRIWDVFAGSTEGEVMTLTEEANTAVAALAVNYRIGPAEVGALGLLDTQNEGEIIKALIDIPALVVLQGKAGAVTPS